jgi:hypothetical protein
MLKSLFSALSFGYLLGHVKTLPKKSEGMRILGVWLFSKPARKTRSGEKGKTVACHFFDIPDNFSYKKLKIAMKYF